MLDAGCGTVLCGPLVAPFARRLVGVDLSARMLDQAKARKAIAVPLNAEAVLVIRRQIGRHQTHVFSFRGKPITQVSTKAWYGALRRAGIDDFRWHDLRHARACFHVQAGTPLQRRLNSEKVLVARAESNHRHKDFQLEA